MSLLPSLTALIALQALDTAADSARKRLADLPAAEQAIDARIAAASTAVETAKARLAANQTARRALEKEVAGVDSRLARFDDHKASVKTNHEYTALLHEISTAKAEKDAVEERLLGLMEEADTIASDVKAADEARVVVEREAADARATITAERRTVEAEVARLSAARSQDAADVPVPLLAKYEQLRKQRRGIAVARVAGELCEACHVRLRPTVVQQIRRNTEIVSCDSCQRILFFEPPVEQPSPAP